MLDIICIALTWYTFAVLARVILSWFPLNPNGAMATAAGFLYTITDPVMNPVRRMLPAARFGRMAFDFSPIVVLIGLSILRNILC